jgi:hypothetical protein
VIRALISLIRLMRNLDQIRADAEKLVKDLPSLIEEDYRRGKRTRSR